MTSHVDAVVVGSGPGGAVTARGLAEAGLEVVVVEEGERVAPGTHPAHSSEQMAHQYRNHGLTVALGSPSISYAEGCGLGGGSEVNSGLYHRPPAEVLTGWSRTYGIEALDLDHLDPWSTLVESELSVAPWPGPQLPAASARLQRGADALGWAGLEVPRWARYHLDQVDHEVRVERQMMSRTYLPRAEAAGAQVRTGLRALRVLRRGTRAVGVEVVEVGSGQVDVISADHVFVCAGPTQTPALLQRSGWRHHIGPNLSVHPTVKVVAEFDDEVNPGEDVATYQVKEFGPWLSFGGSASRPSLLALALAPSSADLADELDRWPRQVVYYAAIQSVGRGHVRTVPGFQDPLVTYRLTREDHRRLRSGLARLLHLVLAGGARRVHPSYAGAPVVHDALTAAEAVRRFDVRGASLMTVHLAGTVPLGEDRARAGADSFGRVHGAEHLWVNDASLLPWAPGVNPEGTVMALAHRNVAHFLAGQGVAVAARTGGVAR